MLRSREVTMRKLSVFNSVSLDGYFTDANNDYSWVHEGANDPELMEFIKGNTQGTNALVFGRVTYEVMVAWWPTREAAKSMPEIAKGMNGHRSMCSRARSTKSTGPTPPY